MVTKLRKIAVLVAVIVVAGSFSLAAGNTESEAKAMQVLDQFMAAFNARAPKQLAQTFNYPHLRISGAKVAIWRTAGDVESDPELTAPVEGDWHHTAWESKKVLQSSKDKVHLAVSATRFRADGSKISTFESLYVVTRQDGHWGILIRSSFAP